MSLFWQLILAGSIALNLFAIWAFLHYLMYGGNPLLQLKRKLTGRAGHIEHPDRTEEENALMRKEASEGKRDPLRVIFFGASITHNWPLEKYFSQFHPVNRGVGGFVPDLISKFKSNVLDLKPRAVVIKLCSINIRPTVPARQLHDGMQMMIQLAQGSDILPIVATMVPAARPAATIGEFSVADGIADFNQWAREYSSENDLAFIDYAKAIQTDQGFLPRDCSVDPVHVNDKGYDLMAEAARPVIHKLLELDR